MWDSTPVSQPAHFLTSHVTSCLLTDRQTSVPVKTRSDLLLVLLSWWGQTLASLWGNREQVSVGAMWEHLSGYRWRQVRYLLRGSQRSIRGGKQSTRTRFPLRTRESYYIISTDTCNTCEIGRTFLGRGLPLWLQSSSAGLDLWQDTKNHISPRPEPEWVTVCLGALTLIETSCPALFPSSSGNSCLACMRGNHGNRISWTLDIVCSTQQIMTGWHADWDVCIFRVFVKAAIHTGKYSRGKTGSELTCSRTFLQVSLISWSVWISSPTFSFTFSAAFSKNCITDTQKVQSGTEHLCSSRSDSYSYSIQTSFFCCLSMWRSASKVKDSLHDMFLMWIWQ